MSETVSEKEELVCRRSPSQILNIRIFSINILIVALIIAIYAFLSQRYETSLYVVLLCFLPMQVIVWNFFKVHCTRYILTNERLTIITGVLNRKTEEIELYRIKDSSFEEPLIYRFFGVGNIRLETSDRSMATVYMRALPHGKAFREDLRRCVEAIREKKNVREVDFQ